MKLSFVAFSLALLQGSYGFAPTGPKLAGHSASSLQASFTDDLLRNRDGNAEAEAEAILKKIRKSLKAPAKASPGIVFKVPTKEQTGVEPHITRLAASFSRQTYELLKGYRTSFDLSTKDHKVDIVLTDQQGVRVATNPTFGAAVCGDTMFLAWRGTQPGQTPVDLLSDFAAVPVALTGKHAKTVRMHMGFSGIAAGDIAYHGQEIIDECKKRGIKEIVTTGHSLGGGIASSAHIILRNLIEDEGSPWNELNGVVNVRSIAFSGPTTLYLEPQALVSASDETKEFIDSVANNSCNIVYFMDFIPRAFGNLKFIYDYADDAIPDLTNMLRDNAGRSGNFLISMIGFAEKIRGTDIDTVVDGAKHEVIDSDQFQLIVQSLNNYIHAGNIIYYDADPTKPPTVLKDMGEHSKNKGEKGTFRSITYEEIKEKTTGRWFNRKTENEYDAIDGELMWHGASTSGPGLCYPELIVSGFGEIEMDIYKDMTD